MSEEPRLPADLARRLPATFAAAVHDQLRQWEFLFPAERRQLGAQLDWLAGLSAAEFDRLFAPLVAIEGRMALGLRDTAAGLGVRDVGILARSPLYPQWRVAVGGSLRPDRRRGRALRSAAHGAAPVARDPSARGFARA
jgi:hypothetical protein